MKDDNKLLKIYAFAAYNERLFISNWCQVGHIITLLEAVVLRAGFIYLNIWGPRVRMFLLLILN